ncbi:hypothetical protein [Dyadobacter alkalitolerans]|uniref:hypothetical protein n=1 Tax=Dyadobacter alkalitolerans TaxID=492736 RepID=UPI0004797FCC|nr:hypothetical protein [Dyadobacter alkalitolerans]
MNEEFEITITAEYLSVSPSIAFVLKDANSFKLKMVLPDEFVKTGGNYYDFIGTELSSSKAKAVYTIKGKFTKLGGTGTFELLRSHKNADTQSTFIAVGRLSFRPKSENAEGVNEKDLRIFATGFVPYLTIAELRTGSAADAVYIVDGVKSGIFRFQPGSAALDDSSMVIQSGSRVYEREFETLRPEYFGGVRNAADNTAPLQKMFDFAHAKRKLDLYIPSGTWIATNLVIYSGLRIRGDGQGSVGLGNSYGSDYNGTILRQKVGATGHFITFFALPDADGYDRIGPFLIENLELLGNGNVNSGDGLRFQSEANAASALRNANATRKTVMQSLTVVRNLVIRGFGGNGMWMPAQHGGVRVENVHPLFNRGYGIFNDLSFGSMEATAFINYDSDANLKGGLCIFGLANFRPNARNSNTIVINGLRSERRTNPTFGGVGNREVVVLDSCFSGTLQITGAFTQSTVMQEKPANLVTLKRQPVSRSMRVIVTGADTYLDPNRGQDILSTPDPSIVADSVNGRYVSFNNSHVIYGDEPQASIFSNRETSDAWQIVGGNKIIGGSPKQGFQAVGNQPGIIFKETDAPANSGGYGIDVSAGKLYFRGINDAGTSTILAGMNSNEWEFLQSAKVNGVLKTNSLAAITPGSNIGNTTNSYGIGYIHTISAVTGQSLKLGSLGPNSVQISANGVQNFQMFPATGNVIIQNGGTFTDVQSSVFTLNSTTKGFRPPVLTTAERDAIPSPVKGLIIINDTTATIDFFNGSVWKTVVTN